MSLRTSRVRLVLASTALVLGFATAAADGPESPLDSAQRAGGGRPARVDFSGGDPGARLSAIRGAPFQAQPEAALPALVALAAGRDPALAPAAAVAAFRIADSLDRSQLEANEADRTEIERARTALVALSRDATARADVRRLATLAASELGAVGTR